MNINKLEAVMLAVLMGVVATLSDVEIQGALHLSPAVVKLIVSVCMLVIGVLKSVVTKKAEETPAGDLK